jgi:hypothetical protein
MCSFSAMACIIAIPYTVLITCDLLHWTQSTYPQLGEETDRLPPLARPSPQQANKKVPRLARGQTYFTCSASDRETGHLNMPPSPLSAPLGLYFLGEQDQKVTLRKQQIIEKH